MYTHHANGLGETPVAAAEPTMWDSILKLGTTVATQGFNIYNRIQNLTEQQKAAAQAQEQARQIAQYSAMYGVQPRPGQPLIPGQPGFGQQYNQYPQPYGQSDFLSGWTMPLLLAGAAIIGVVLFKRK